MALRALILRKTRSIGHKDISEKDDEFDFETGTYFIRPEAVFMRRGFISYKPHLLYIEGCPLPIDLTRLKMNLGDMKKIYKIDGEEIPEPELFIDSFTIHDLTSKKLLRVLIGEMGTTELIIIILIVIGLIIGGVNIILSM